MKKQKKKKRNKAGKNRSNRKLKQIQRDEAGKEQRESGIKQKSIPSYQKRQDVKRVKEGKKNPIYYIKKGIGFIQESQVELRKVKWPTRKELIASTAMVLFLVLIVAAFLGLVDLGLIKLIKNIIQ